MALRYYSANRQSTAQCTPEVDSLRVESCTPDSRYLPASVVCVVDSLVSKVSSMEMVNESGKEVGNEVRISVDDMGL